MEKKEIGKMAELTSRISTLNALLGVEVEGQPYFSVNYLKKMLKLTENEMRMMKIAKIFYDE
jgi:hypothetical protein